MFKFVFVFSVLFLSGCGNNPAFQGNSTYCSLEYVKSFDAVFFAAEKADTILEANRVIQLANDFKNKYPRIKCTAADARSPWDNQVKVYLKTDDMDLVIAEMDSRIKKYR